MTLRNRLSGADFKPFQVAAIKSSGYKRWRKGEIKLAGIAFFAPALKDL